MQNSFDLIIHQLFAESARRNNRFKLYVETVMRKHYGLGNVDIKGNLTQSPEEMIAIVDTLIGEPLMLIWNLVDEKVSTIQYQTNTNVLSSQNHPIPFFTAAIEECLEFLFFETTGSLGILYQRWYGDRYPNCGFAYTLAMVSFPSQLGVMLA